MFVILSKPNAYLTSGRNGEQALVVVDRHKRLTSDGDEPLTASAISAGGAFFRLTILNHFTVIDLQAFRIVG